MKDYYQPINVIVVPSVDYKSFQIVHLLYNASHKIHFRKYVVGVVPLYYVIIKQNYMIGEE